MIALVLLAGVAQAAEPLVRGLAVGGLAAGGEVVGGVALAAAGAAIGSTLCHDDAVECWAPLYGLGLGVTLGGVGGAMGGGALGARWMDAPVGRVVGYEGLAIGAGTTLLVVGLVTESGGLQQAGIYTAVIGMPLAAGLAAAGPTASSSRQTASIAPILSPETPGVVVSARF